MIRERLQTGFLTLDIIFAAKRGGGQQGSVEPSEIRNKFEI